MKEKVSFALETDLEKSNQHKIIKLHCFVKIINNWHSTMRIGGDQLWEIGTANTAHGMTTCDELDHFGLVEALITKTFSEGRDILLRLRCAVVSWNIGVNTTSSQWNNWSSACGHCKYGTNGYDVSSCAELESERYGNEKTGAYERLRHWDIFENRSRSE